MANSRIVDRVKIRVQDRFSALAPFAAVLLLAGSAAANAGTAEQGRDCQVRKILDGDSLILDCAGDRLEVRLRCIDAPEKDQRPWSDRSRANLRRITPARVEVIPIERDRFGRTVADLYGADSERRFINLEQVSSGNAAVYRRYCKDPRFMETEREARRSGRGIWSEPGEHQSPWRFRHRH
ncbi:thermonuclease family protein [Imhoffiella purpurea]|uniref:Nuclease n=1 Tax=Imhoffiella purpurea TaxID=1249627 RepID=W9V7X5_9GAMM|nr:thermonuclease family protein [Imhoffiella purpurea]EXJ15683.1 nuclease [Imhoffiella purpurea]